MKTKNTGSSIRMKELTNIQLSSNMEFKNIEKSLDYLLKQRAYIARKINSSETGEADLELYEYVNEKIKLLLALS